jgi:hypothetical protein
VVLVDSTVWIDFFNGVETPETGWLDRELSEQRLGALDPIVCEVLQGVSSDEEADDVLGELRRPEIFDTGVVVLASGGGTQLSSPALSEANRSITDEGKMEVSIREVDFPPPPLRTIYRLSRFTVESVAMSDAYWVTHRRLEREGKLAHSSETCPERLGGKVVKIWQQETGWKDVTAPQAFGPFGNAATR